MDKEEFKLKFQNTKILRITSICLTILCLGLMSASITHAAYGYINAGYLDANGNLNGGPTLSFVFYLHNNDYISTPVSVNWDFGDGTTGTSTLKNGFSQITHSYSKPGTYNASCIDLNNGDKTNDIKIYAYLPTTANFTSDVNIGPAPLTVQFKDTSEGTPTSWYWYFNGDNSNSTDQNPTHTFNWPPYDKQQNYTYEVVLSVTNPYDILLRHPQSQMMNYITVTRPQSLPIASFTANPTFGDAPLNVAFTDTSQSLITLRNWNFGDGNTSTDPDPTNIYSKPGNYQVSLIVTNATGTDTTLQTITINQSTPTPIPTPTPTPTPTSKLTPIITWNNPDDISVGTALGKDETFYYFLVFIFFVSHHAKQ